MDGNPGKVPIDHLVYLVSCRKISQLSQESHLDSTVAAAPMAAEEAEVGGVEDAAMAPDERSASSLSWEKANKQLEVNKQLKVNKQLLLFISFLGLIDLVDGVDHDLGLLGQVADATAKGTHIVGPLLSCLNLYTGIYRHYWILSLPWDVDQTIPKYNMATLP